MTTPAANYHGVHIYQGATSPCPFANCNPTSHVVMAGMDWLGAKPAGTAQVGAVRNWIDSHYGIGCAGTTNAQNDAAVKALFGTDLSHRWDVSPSQVPNGLAGGAYRISAFELYATWIGTPWNYGGSFRGGHEVVYKARRYNATISTPRYELLRCDPLNKTTDQWVPEALALAAMEAGFSDHNVEFSISRSFAAGAPKKVLYPGGRYRSSPKVTTTNDLGAVPQGALLTVASVVTGGSWVVNGKAGSAWCMVTAVNGVAVQNRYVAQGWAIGPSGAY